MSTQNIFSVKIGGQAGQGVKSAGLMLAKTATRSGYHIYNYTEYPSLIRGGHNVMQINISREKIGSPLKKLDLLIALNQDAIDLHASELLPGSALLFDSKYQADKTKINQEAAFFPVPLTELADQAHGQALSRNTIAIGAAVAFLGGDLTILKSLISEEFADKGAETVEANCRGAENGFNYIREHFADNLKTVLATMENQTPKMIVNGNEAVALGAIAAGLQFTAIYPMSPVSGILQVLAANQEKFGLIYKQPEDEISAINMSIGASFAGARSMTVTSGGGFCLMTEGYGLAGMTETPLVIILGMRPGPATGLPTWSDQGDLQFVLRAHQGDFPRIVLSAGDPEEAFNLTMEAFNLADKYQTPVVVLIDKNICEDEQSFPIFDISAYEVNRGKFTTQPLPDYKRFTLETDGISLRTIPGSGNFFIANSYTHNAVGFTTEDPAEAASQMEKRMAKLKTCATVDMPTPQLFGPAEADITIVSWGSNKGAILQALKDLPNVNFLYLNWMNPFPAEAVKNTLSKARRLIDIECNYSAQLADLIREKTGIEIADELLRFDGRPFYPEEISEKIRRTLKNNTTAEVDGEHKAGLFKKLFLGADVN